jgi:hypothetical protein
MPWAPTPSEDLESVYGDPRAGVEVPLVSIKPRRIAGQSTLQVKRVRRRFEASTNRMFSNLREH